MLKKEPQRIRGFINNGKGNPEFYEQKINLYVRNLQYKIKNKSVLLAILKESEILINLTIDQVCMSRVACHHEIIKLSL